MKVKPLGDRLLVKVLQVEEKTKGGIYIPQTAQEKTQHGIVEEIGDPELVKVKVGQKVIYDKYAGTQIKIDDVEYLILKNDDVLAIIED
ncbi:MAG: co-chaperone GroES [Brevinematales bacterium]|nr:co-chaperone GroES [Brevinematales bacterium]